jgi:protein gp37
MAADSLIGWTDNTMNFWMGCTKVSTECVPCYIEQVLGRMGVKPFQGPIRTKNWTGPKKWNKRAMEQGKRLRVFTCSLSDFFHVGADAWRSEAWDIVRECRQIDWQVLTKRPDLIADRLPPDWGEGYPNVWLGVTCGISSSIWEIEEVLKIPAASRFVSAEPLLGPLDLRPYLGQGIDWVITGCEQAAKENRRVMDLDWVRDLDQQCREAAVPHFFKQYYLNEQGVPKEDGVLDGRRRQAFPRRRRKARQ